MLNDVFFYFKNQAWKQRFPLQKTCHHQEIFRKGDVGMIIFHIFNLSVTISKNENHLKPVEIEHNEHVKKLMAELDRKRNTYLYMYS